MIYIKLLLQLFIKCYIFPYFHIISNIYLLNSLGGILLKRIFPIILVVLLSFQCVLPAVSATVNTDKDLFDINVEPNATSEQAVIDISALDDSIESVEVMLPEQSKFSQEKLASQAIELKDDKKSHTVTIKKVR